ncbi:hypothetical protein RO21_08890 [[Actinobacillus] muris]|uniref:Uncharacterized protein n=1 Tax=Muribacter muris TaxID=67855 RepID=A0A0J5P5H1_9PAST|nr:hypothetical protein [Muribacter muris]KMK51000.1 hypothetical protein RO21_08890 [[Actinobacillus] muris] [Muribacter muris]
MLTIDNIKLSYLYFEDINYSEKRKTLLDKDVRGVEVSCSINNLQAEIGEAKKNGEKTWVIKNSGEVFVDSGVFILKVKFLAFFDIIDVEIDKENIKSSKEYFDKLINMSIEETRKKLNSDFSKLLKLTQFDSGAEYEFWEKENL